MPNLWWIKANDFISFHKKSPQEWDYAIDNESDFYHGAGDKLGVFVSEKAKSFMESLCLPLKYNELWILFFINDNKVMDFVYEHDERGNLIKIYKNNIEVRKLLQKRREQRKTGAC